MTNPTLQRKQSDWSIKDKIRSDYCRGEFALLGGRGFGGGDVSLFISTWLHFSVRVWFNLSDLQSLFANVMSAAAPKSASRVGYARAKGELQFARWRHFTTTTRGLQFVAFIAYLPIASSLCFNARLSAKLLIWEWSFILMQKNHVHDKGFVLSLVLKVRVFGSRKGSIRVVVFLNLGRLS